MMQLAEGFWFVPRPPIIWQFAIVHRFLFVWPNSVSSKKAFGQRTISGLAGLLSESKSSSNSWWSASCFYASSHCPHGWGQWSTKSISTNMLHSIACFGWRSLKICLTRSIKIDYRLLNIFAQCVEASKSHNIA
jgi:hypothetical protein